MMMSPEFGFAVLATPKCGSSALERALAPVCPLRFTGHPQLKHLTARHYHEHLAPYFRDHMPWMEVEVIAVIREPVDWLFSWYRFRSRPELRDPAHRKHAVYTGDMSFEAFVTAYLEPDPPRFASLVNRSQAEFLSLRDGRPGVDRLWAYEHLEDLVARLSGRVGQGLSLKKVNRSPERRNDLPAGLERTLREALARDGAWYELARRGRPRHFPAQG